jgi:ADP-ribosylglycohydrolase
MDALASEGWAGKRAGSLVGQALGDALGFPVEGCSPAECASYVDSVLRRRPAVLPGRPPFAFGQYTDDTQLARELALSCVSGAFDGAAFGQRVATIFAEDRIVGRGRTTEAAALRLARGVPWQSAGTPAPAAGNGSAMRAAPIGWLHAIGPALVRDAVAQSRVTHADPRSCAGAVAIAGAVSLALREDHVDAGAWVATLGDFAAPIHAGFADEVRRLTDWLALSSDAAAPGIARAGFEPGVSDRWPGISPFVVPSVLWSLYCFLRSSSDYWETICTAIAVGGDVDTTAAMAGAISGAFLGEDAFSEPLARQVNDRGTWGYDELVALALRFEPAS